MDAVDSTEARKPVGPASRIGGIEERRRRPLSAFVCYARESDCELRKRLSDELQARGIEAKGDWLLMPGPSYKEQLAALIIESDVFIAVISRLSVESPECRDEIEQAYFHKKKLLPVQIESGFDKRTLHE